MQITTKSRIIFAGTPQFAATALNKLIAKNYNIIAVYTQPDRPAGRGRKLQISAVKQLAAQFNIQIFQPESLKNPEKIIELQQLSPDIMIVAAYGLILPQKILSSPKLGCINIHASLLPRWRGAAPIQRAILANDKQTGISIMQMDAGLDTGDVLYKATCPITNIDTSETLHEKLMHLGADALIHTLEKYPQLKPTAQNHTQATYAKKINRSDAFIDWQQSADNISRQIRAFNPKPGAFIGQGSQIIKIWQAEKAQNIDAKNIKPGHIVCAKNNQILIATGDGVLKIKQLQLAGKRKITAKELLNSKKNMINEGINFAIAIS